MTQQQASVVTYNHSILSDITQDRSPWRLFVFMVVSWLPALVGYRLVASVTALYPLADSATPYFIPAYALTLYLWMPLVIASACLLFLSPGLFLSLGLNAAKNVGQWILTSFVLSLVVISVVAGIGQGIMGSSLQGSPFAFVVVGCSLACFGFLLVRLNQKKTLAWPLHQPYSRATLLSMVVPLILFVALTPKFFWENFNGDGVHAFESARLLLVQALPFWSAEAGEIANFPGITSVLFAFPASWFIRLFGEVEVAARLPLLLYLVALYGAILALAEHGRQKLLGLPERWLIWLGLVVYVIVMAFSATYNPYSADIALPATQDTLLMVCFFGFVLGFLRREWGWAWFFIGLTFVSLPSGVLLIGFWWLAVLLIWRPLPWRQLALVATAVLSCFVIAAILPHILAFFGLPTPGGEYGSVGLLRRFAFLQWSDWYRFAFLVVPSGILPALMLLAWRWQDRVARTLTIVTAFYFIFFYIQAHITLHHFVPVMLLPLAVFWRIEWVTNFRHRRLMLMATTVAGIIALLISLPKDFTPHTSARLIGAAIEDRIGGYEALDPAVFRRSKILNHLFSYDWEPVVPFETYGGAPIVWNYYAHLSKSANQEINYVLQPAADPPPPGMRLLTRQGDVALYLHSDEVWMDHRGIRPPTPAGSPVYTLPRGILFRSIPLEGGPTIINVVGVIESLGINMGPILGRLGVER